MGEGDEPGEEMQVGLQRRRRRGTGEVGWPPVGEGRVLLSVEVTDRLHPEG